MLHPQGMRRSDARPGHDWVNRRPRGGAGHLTYRSNSSRSRSAACVAPLERPGVVGVVTSGVSIPTPRRPARGGLRLLVLRLAAPNVRCHSAWYFRSRRHSISVGMPLQASENINKMIGVDATSKSVRVKAAWTIRPLRRLVVDPNRSIGELSRSRPASTRRGSFACFD